MLFFLRMETDGTPCIRTTQFAGLVTGSNPLDLKIDCAFHDQPEVDSSRMG